MDGTNRFSFALSDAVSPTVTAAAVVEETCAVECAADFGLALMCAPCPWVFFLRGNKRPRVEMVEAYFIFMWGVSHI
jgi:hypothetical protein